MPKVLLSVPPQRQQDDGDCLAAQAAMLLIYLEFPLNYSSLRQLLNIQPFGALAGNIRRLARLDLNVTYSQTDLKGLETMLQEGQPVIVFVRTSELPYFIGLTALIMLWLS